MLNPSLESVVAAIHANTPSAIAGAKMMKRAAVAVVLRQAPAGPELLFIRRAESEGDPWSGHMAFPGGRMEEGETPYDAALRETHEELGFDLAATSRSAGGLSELMAKARGRAIPLVISPFVFVLESEIVTVPNYEVAEVLWVPFSFFVDAQNRSTMPYKWGGVKLMLPCYEYEGRTIWGLTLKMLDELLEWVGRR